jgi:hypothetical protein
VCQFDLPRTKEPGPIFILFPDTLGWPRGLDEKLQANWETVFASEVCSNKTPLAKTNSQLTII